MFMILDKEREKEVKVKQNRQGQRGEEPVKI